MSSREVSVLSTTKVDPRIIRTKKLLVEAFQEVSREKRMSQITVKDITERATVNRATFMHILLINMIFSITLYLKRF